MPQDQTDIVKTQERGQVTIPIEFREKLGITPKSWLLVQLVEGPAINLHPIKKPKKRGDISEFLKWASKDKKSHWTKRDAKALTQVRKKTAERLKKNTKW